MSNPSDVLSEEIERLVGEHLEAMRRAAAVAVARAFSSSETSVSAAANTGPATARPGVTSRTRTVRRSAAELSALGERLHKAVCAHPGETISVLAPTVGKSPRELSRPMMALRRAGRVRSVGQRHHTRYFPTVAGSSAG